MVVLKLKPSPLFVSASDSAREHFEPKRLKCFICTGEREGRGDNVAVQQLPTLSLRVPAGDRLSTLSELPATSPARGETKIRGVMIVLLSASLMMEPFAKGIWRPVLCCCLSVAGFASPALLFPNTRADILATLEGFSCWLARAI